MDCDDIPWAGGKPKKQERLDAHKDQLKNVQSSIKNAKDELASPKLAGI